MEQLIKSAIDGDGGLKKYLQDSVVLLSWIRSNLGDLLKEALEGDPAATKELTNRQGELGKALTRAFEAEDRFHAWYAKQSGEDAAGDIDFDALREEIGCRLARLRECE